MAEVESISAKDQRVLEDRRGYQDWTQHLPAGMFKRVVSKLFSNEDKHQFHKTLGLLSVLSFMYRYFYVLPTQGNLGFEGTWFDHATIFIHMLLSCSSLLFHVLSMRIVNRPMIIWEEYRLHAIIFSTRCFSVFYFAYFGPFKGTIWNHLLLPIVVLVHHVGADLVTKKHGPKDKSTTTVRVKDDGDIVTTMFLRFYALYQFCALGSHLVPNERLMDLGFNTFIAIQSSAFLMTLYRKGLIIERYHAFWYTFCLVLSMIVIYRECADTLFVVKLGLVYFLRVKFGINKYFLWTCFALLALPQSETFIKQFYAQHTQRDLDAELATAGNVMFQSLLFAGSKDL